VAGARHFGALWLRVIAVNSLEVGAGSGY
jgi:hypothetical protein